MTYTHDIHTPPPTHPPTHARFLEKRDWAGAYQMACLGVTDADWRALALSALQVRGPRFTLTCSACSSTITRHTSHHTHHTVFSQTPNGHITHYTRQPLTRQTHAHTPNTQEMEVDVARQAFIRVRDLRAVELVDRVAAGLTAGLPRGLLVGDVFAWQGRYQEAARCFVNEGRLDKVCVCVGRRGSLMRCVMCDWVDV
jgi:hypothetical protein